MREIEVHKHFSILKAFLTSTLHDNRAKEFFLLQVKCVILLNFIAEFIQVDFNNDECLRRKARH